MSRQLDKLRESRGQGVNLRDFTNSVDIKRFSRERGNMTPLHQPCGNFFKKIYERSNEKIRNTRPTSLAVTFSKHISHKNMQTKRKVSSGCTTPYTQSPQRRTITPSASTSICSRRSTQQQRNCLRWASTKDWSLWLGISSGISNTPMHRKISTTGWPCRSCTSTSTRRQWRKWPNALQFTLIFNRVFCVSPAAISDSSAFASPLKTISMPSSWTRNRLHRTCSSRIAIRPWNNTQKLWI